MDLENERIIENNLRKTEQDNLLDAIKTYEEKRTKGIEPTIEINENITIDRIEENIAVCELESGETINIETKNIPFEVKEMDILRTKILYENGQIKDINILEKNENERQRRLEIIQEKLKKIKENNIL